MRRLLAAMAMAAAVLPAQAASFNCTKAATPVETTICDNDELSELDSAAARYYRNAQDTLPGAKACLLADQRAWLQIRNRCADAACLKDLYLSRLAELDKVQPARRAGEPMALPERSFLVGIIPPTDRPPDAAESDPARATQLDITGTLTEAEGGFIFTAPDGRAIALMTWYIEPTALDQLKAAMMTPGTRFAVRGFAGRNSASGQSYIEPRRCAFVYQLPTP
jgi:uncharacterized protein